jgi:hypothetical protein
VSLGGDPLLKVAEDPKVAILCAGEVDLPGKISRPTLCCTTSRIALTDGRGHCANVGDSSDVERRTSPTPRADQGGATKARKHEENLLTGRERPRDTISVKKSV